MDISSEAKVDSFSIGPSTVDVVLPVLSWFHPRNAQGILVMVTLVAFLLKRFTNVRARAESAYRRKFWRNMMRSALTYEEWGHAAKMLDKEQPKTNEADLYDEELVRNKLQELRQRRQEGSLRDIVFCMRADLFRNLGNMCNPQLHKGRLQVPKLIKEYIDEVSAQLKIICNSDSEELLLEEKLAFMHETRHAFGRTALLLSGGASLGAFHVGVVRTLVENKLLPRIIAGSSVGSIMCAVSFFEDSWHSLQFFDQLGGIFTVVRRVMTQGALHEIRHLQMLLRNLTSNLTFQEAYDMTGRILGVTVCSPRKHEPPRCLNYLTSPNVVIWSAVTASCAFPGLFEAQELMAKDRAGNLAPPASARRWRDGSLESDLPMIQLKELFNVNHFIVSQANPHIAPLLRLKELVRAYGGTSPPRYHPAIWLNFHLAHLAEMEVKHRCNQILELGFPLGGLAKLFAQEWEGDVTVVMPATLAQYSKIIRNPSHVELQKAANQGRRCTWEKLSAIKANCAIELALDECVAVLNHMRRLKRSAERAAAVSQGSPPLPGSARQRGSPRGIGSPERTLPPTPGGTSGSAVRPQHGVHDGSDSESDSGDLGSWTRSGGPLMRTSSANKFITFVQSLGAREDAAESHDAAQHSVSFTIQGLAAGGEPHHDGGLRVTTPDGGDSENNVGSPTAEETPQRLPPAS
ncbi:unnamed protein product [Spirodela intermedia]|uniref:PNPLA domain-containing protein n=1 Tax=Spirodela intermedia TaxID=51605 RepID=A0A7I8IAP0_SPIIN|nr:unnamed protein product [Spirodela intermedia]CAA6654102.1 unnamed protein product [Spirodela intermedia]